MSAVHAAFAALCLAATPPPASCERPPGTATVPLEQLLPLLEQKVAARAPVPPPVDAVVTRAELKGRLTTDAVHLDVHFEVRVLAGDRWTRVPLLEVPPETVVTSESHSEDGVVAVHDGHLLLLASKPGAYVIDAAVNARAAQSGPRRSVALRMAPGGPPVPLLLEVDPAFTVVEPAASAEPSVFVYPRAGAWSVAWTVAERKASPRVAQRPALEPKILRARAVWVSTLEGKLGLRVAYALRLNRPEKITVELPEGHRLERAMVNGRPVPLPEAGRPLEVEVAPPNVGDSEARLELVLAEDLGVLHLSGTVRLSMPRASWPIADVAAEAYLPAVFNYRRQGGSLEHLPEGGEGEGGASPSWAETFGAMAGESDALPGKVLRFRQYLVSSSAPDVELGYSVDIAKSYFR